MGISFHATCCRWSVAPSCLWQTALAGVLLSMAGCGSFNAQTCNTDGVQLFQQARYQEAIKEFQEATYEDPTNADGYYNLAATYHRIGKLERRKTDLDQAESYYNLCLDRNPNHTDCYRGLAVLLAEQGRNDDAFRLLEGWVQRQPNSADAKIELARMNEEFGNRQVAKERLIEALAAQPRQSGGRLPLWGRFARTQARPGKPWPTISVRSVKTIANPNWPHG